MKNSLISNLSSQKIWIFFMCLLCHLSTIKSAQFTEYNYTLDIPEIRVKQLEPSKDEKLKLYQGELLKEFLIKEPKQIGEVYQVQILPRNDSKRSQELQDNVIEEVNAISLKGLWFESFLWPIKTKSYLYSLQKTISNTREQDEQIISATSSSQLQNLSNPFSSNHFPLYILLSSGKIQVIQNEFETLKQKKEYIYYASSNQTQIHQWNDGFLYHKNGSLYLLVLETLYTVSLTDVNEGSNTSRFFTLKQIAVKNVRQVIEDGKDLYAFTEETIYKIRENEPNLVIKFSDIYSAFKLAQQKLMDISIFNKNLYLLNHLGVLKCSQLQAFSFLRIQHPEMAKKINVFDQTIIITYEIKGEQVIQEYQFIPKTQQFHVNKIYDQHSDEDVRNILLYENYMIINREASLSVGVHSLNRQMPFQFHDKSQGIISHFFFDEMYELRSVGDNPFGTPSYLVVGPNSVELIKFETNSDQQMQQKWIRMGSQKTGFFEFDIRYTGTCKFSHFYSSEYCSITNSIQLIVNDSTGQEIHSWWIWLLATIGALIACGIVFALSCRYFTKKQNQFESLVSSRRNSKNNASVTLVEMTPEKQNDEKTQAN